MDLKTQTFDLHVVANSLPPKLEAELIEMGYEPKVIIGGDPRVRMQHLLSYKAADRLSGDDHFKRSVSAIESYPTFVGYIEEEAIAHDLSITRSEHTGEAGRFPEQYRVNNCPEGTYKKCDIHVAVSCRHAEVIQRLKDAGFYYLNLLKPGLGSVNVMTIQTEDMKTGKSIWGVLLRYLQGAGGFNGFAKFEVTAALKNFGFKLPPIVLKDSASNILRYSD